MHAVISTCLPWPVAVCRENNVRGAVAPYVQPDRDNKVTSSTFLISLYTCVSLKKGTGKDRIFSMIINVYTKQID